MKTPDRDTVPGLRERKKAHTRTMLSTAALRLAMERGVANVRVEDIAAEAGMSTRTFNNYFPNKEAAIVGVAALRADHFCAALRARPAKEELHDALTAAVLDLFAEEPDREWIARSQLIRDEPALLAEERKSDLHIERTIAAEIANRYGLDPTADLRPRLAAALVVSTIHAAIRYWLDIPAGTLRQTLTAAMAQIHIR